MNIERLVQIIALEAIAVTVVLLLLMQNQDESIEIFSPKNVLQSPCSGFRAKIHRQQGRSELISCIVKLNDIELT